MAYTPTPIDTSSVQLPETLVELVEFLAQNAHDTWAQQRMEDGWIYGLKRDDDKKCHPDLIPYEKLPDSEKEYDRKMAVETLKVILLNGYEIKKT